MAGEIGVGDLGVPPVISAEISTRRFTAEDVERAKAEKAAAYSKLMDDMEASVESQGQWFVKLGEKKPITQTQQVTQSGGFLGTRKTLVDREVTTGHDDSRALVLKAISRVNSFKGQEGESTHEQQEFTVVTPDGIFVAPFYNSEIENPQIDYARDHQRQFGALKDLVAGVAEPTKESKYAVHSFENGNVSSRIALNSGDLGAYSGIQLTEPVRYNISFGPEDFQKRVQESIALTESPHKVNVEKANAQTELAKSAVNIVSTLPPRE